MERTRYTKMTRCHGDYGHVRQPTNNVRLLFLVALSVGLVCAGCGRTGKQSFTEAGVRSSIVLGMRQEQVEEIFGRPALLTRTSDGRTMAIYQIAESLLPETFQHTFTGFSLYYTNRHVERWFPTYSDRATANGASELRQRVPRTNDIVAGPADNDSSREEVSIYAVSETELEGGTAVNIPTLSLVGYIRQNPDLSIRKLESVGKGNEFIGGSGVDRQVTVITVGLLSGDARVFQNLTERHLGERLLIILRQSPVAAPYVTVPISGGKFSIPCGSEQDCDSLVRRLQKLLN